MLKQIDLINIFVEGLKRSGFTDIEVTKNILNMNVIKMRKINNIILHVFIRKVSKSGWSDKPQKRRVQVSAFDIDKLPATGKTTTCMIIGIQELFDRNIFVAWNIYNYGVHTTNRSCYVSTHNLYNGFVDGFLTTTDQSQKVWIADEYNLDKLISDYMVFNYSSIGE